MDEGIVRIPLNKQGFRNWQSVSDDELISYAKGAISEKKIGGRLELARTDSGLYRILKLRKLLDRVGFPNYNEGKRDWARFKNDELVAYAKRFIAENGITCRGGLGGDDYGLYSVLLKRGLIEEIGLSDTRGERRIWKGMGDEELVAYAKKFIAERGIAKREELRNADSGLYQALHGKRLLDETGIKSSVDGHRDWEEMSDDEIVAHAKGFMEEIGIRGRSELQRADPGFYGALLKREKESPGMMERVGFEEKLRDWATMSDDEIVAHAKGFLEERGIRGKGELHKTDRGLYNALHKREKNKPGIMERVFSDIQSSKHMEAVDGVLDALGSFGDEK